MWRKTVVPVGDVSDRVKCCRPFLYKNSSFCLNICYSTSTFMLFFSSLLLPAVNIPPPFISASSFLTSTYHVLLHHIHKSPLCSLNLLPSSINFHWYVPSSSCEHVQTLSICSPDLHIPHSILLPSKEMLSLFRSASCLLLYWLSSPSFTPFLWFLLTLVCRTSHLPHSLHPTTTHFFTTFSLCSLDF